MSQLPDTIRRPSGLNETLQIGLVWPLRVCEGEKAAEAARSLGLTATASAHGSQAAGTTEWSPLAGKEVVILPDNDGPGDQYADAVVSALRDLVPLPVIKRFDLPNLPEHGDADDFVAANPGVEVEELRQMVEDLADAAQPIQPTLAEVSSDGFVPCPVDALPEPIRGFVTMGAKAIGCDPSYLVLPILTVLASAIGTTRRLELKRGWTVPAILWTAIVGESGTAKAPAFKLAMRPLRKRQERALSEYEHASRKHDEELLRYEKVLAKWKGPASSNDAPPERPKAPQAERVIVNDVTVEALAPLLRDNPRGLLLERDELAAWMDSFDRYAHGKGDAAHWLSMHSGEDILVDRKTGNSRTIFVRQAAVCICGGIQPAILNRALGTEHREPGLEARLLMTHPPRKAKQWTDADIDPSDEAQYARLVDRLFELQPDVDDDGNEVPVLVRLTARAKEVWTDYYNEHGREQAELSGELAAAWSKLEEYAARLTLVIHFARWAADDGTLVDFNEVDEASMAAGTRLARWFKGETRRVYSLLAETDEHRERRRLVEWLKKEKEPVTAREVQNAT